jgi:hypothetical protein
MTRVNVVIFETKSHQRAKEFARYERDNPLGRRNARVSPKKVNGRYRVISKTTIHRTRKRKWKK